jgi:hypothetical protein
MKGKGGSEWRSATQLAMRRFGLSDARGAGPVRLAAVLIVLGAALLATGTHVAAAVGAVLWLAGAVIAVRAWIVLERMRRTKSS